MTFGELLLEFQNDLVETLKLWIVIGYEFSEVLFLRRSWLDSHWLIVFISAYIYFAAFFKIPKAILQTLIEERKKKKEIEIATKQQENEAMASYAVSAENINDKNLLSQLFSSFRDSMNPAKQDDLFDAMFASLNLFAYISFGFGFLFFVIVVFMEASGLPNIFLQVCQDINREYKC